MSCICPMTSSWKINVSYYLILFIVPRFRKLAKFISSSLRGHRCAAYVVVKSPTATFKNTGSIVTPAQDSKSATDH